jgi:chemotaxis protein methyltransferase CheR
MTRTADADILSDRDFDRVSRAVYAHCGITLGAGKRSLVQARLARRVRETACRDYSRYIDAVLADKQGDEFLNFIDSLSTNLTSFFREPQHFDFLAKQHLPDLLGRKQSTRRLRGWSAGCSSGEEPYSLAIVLREALASLGAADLDFRLLATDISTRVLARARAGVYEDRQLDGVSPQRRAHFFERRVLQGRPVSVVHPNLRSMISFNHLNLIERWPFSGPFDFIFCRNVMIYFDKPTQQALVERYHSVLAPGGLLFTGHSESLTNIRHDFTLVRPTIYKKQ